MGTEWSLASIGDLCDRDVATIQTGPFGSQLHAHEYRAVGTPVVPTEAIGRRRIADGDLPRVDDGVVARLARHRLRAGDILFARRGAQATGSSAIVEKNLEGAICGTGAILMRVCRPAIVDPTYLSFALAAPSSMQWLKDHAVGAVMPNLNTDVIRRLEVPLPPLGEQRAIAHILGTLDDKIELNRKMNQTLEEMARALFKSWFVDFDPVRAKAAGKKPHGMDDATAALFPDNFEQSELGEIPKGWARAPLGTWVSTFSGGTPSKKDGSLWGGSIPWISPKVMTAIHADDADNFVTPDAIGNGTRIAPAGATLVMVRGMGLHQEVRVSQARGDVTFNQDVKALVPKGIEANLLLFAMLDGQAALLGRVESSGHGTGKLPSEVLLGHSITLPRAAVQQRLVQIFDRLNVRIAESRGESRTLAAASDQLLPRLLSGELPVASAVSAARSVA
jgi:type I restriction enzyme S subunit